jgi:hypothetical protein
VLDRTDIKNPRLSTIRGRLYVNHPEHWLVLSPSGLYGSNNNGDELVIDMEGPEEVRIIGRLIPPPHSSEPVWIRIEAAPSREHVEAGVDRNGEFHLYDPISGWNIVTVFEGSKVLHAEPLYVPDPKSFQKLDIHLKSP